MTNEQIIELAKEHLEVLVNDRTKVFNSQRQAQNTRTQENV